MQLQIRHLCMTIIFAAPALASPVVPDFEFHAGEKQMRLSDARGAFTVIHYLPTMDAKAMAHLAAIERECDGLAGVRHIVISPAMNAPGTKYPFSQERNVRLAISAYSDGQISQALNIHGTPQPNPTIIFVDPSGIEVFRRIGKSADDYLPVGELFARVDHLSTSPAASEYNLRGKEPAIKGYDPVSYFESRMATMGQSTLTSRFRGVTYQFSSLENRRKFADSPRNYLPTYGGWCATAMAEGDKVDIDPTNFKITSGRLFLFYKGWLGNARNDWDKNEAALTRKADAQWNRIAPSM